MMNPVVQEHVIRLGRMSRDIVTIQGRRGRVVEILHNPGGDHLMRYSGPDCIKGGKRVIELLYFSPVGDVDPWPGDRFRISFGGRRRSKIFEFRGMWVGDHLVATSGPFGEG